MGGLEQQVTEIKEAVELPLTHPELYQDIGIKPPKVQIRGPVSLCISSHMHMHHLLGVKHMHSKTVPGKTRQYLQLSRLVT